MTDAPKSNQVEPTKGPWTYEATGSQPGAFSIVGDAQQMVALVYGETRDAQRKNARLIAEAGTVYSESGLSPRALLEQRDEAVAANERLSAALKSQTVRVWEESDRADKADHMRVSIETDKVHPALAIDVAEHRQQAFQNGWNDGYSEGLGKGQVRDRDATENLRKLRDLVQVLIDNDPDELIADNGMTVLDGWRDRAQRVVADIPAEHPCPECGGERHQASPAEAWHIVKRWIAGYDEEEQAFSKYHSDAMLDGVMTAGERRSISVAINGTHAAELKAREAETIERCAKVVERRAFKYDGALRDAAAAIRALAPVTGSPPQDLHKVEREDDGWLPIESAPRDGTRILWCSPKEPWAKLPHIYCVIHWPEYSDCFESGSWRPLPPPPAAARGE